MGRISSTIGFYVGIVWPQNLNAICSMPYADYERRNMSTLLGQPSGVASATASSEEQRRNPSATARTELRWYINPDYTSSTGPHWRHL